MGLDVDAAAVVVDNHTGKVVAQFSGFGAEADAKSHMRICQKPGTGKDKVDHMSSCSVVTGDNARKAMKTGRV